MITTNEISNWLKMMNLKPVIRSYKGNRFRMYVIDDQGKKVVPAEVFSFYPRVSAKTFDVDNKKKIKNKTLQKLLLKLMRSNVLIESYVRHNTDFDNKGIKL